MRTLEEWQRDYFKFSELYKEFKNSDVALDVFLAQVEEIFKENRRGSIQYRNLLAFRSGLKKFDLSACTVREMVRHEGMHVRIARKIIKDVGTILQLGVEYILEPLLSKGIFGDSWVIAPSVDFPNLISVIGHSKRKYVEFLDKMVDEHPNPSEMDKLFTQKT